MTDAFVLGGVRTPFARYGSSLSHIRADELLGMTMKGACERVGVGLDQVEDIVAGCVNPAHEGMGDVARWAALAAGFPDSVAGATINRFCGSSVSATINVAHAIMAGDLGAFRVLRACQPEVDFSEIASIPVTDQQRFRKASSFSMLDHAAPL